MRVEDLAKIMAHDWPASGRARVDGLDVDRDGIQDAGEAGIGGVLVPFPAIKLIDLALAATIGA